MKKFVVLFLMLLIFMSFEVIAIAGGSITPNVTTSPTEDTYVKGRVYDADFSTGISDASVIATCNGISKNTETDSFGDYVIMFDTTECRVGNIVTVIATKDNLSGAGSDSVHYYYGIEINLAIVDVPMTPEFGFVLGGFTLISAIGIFLVIRRD